MSAPAAALALGPARVAKRGADVRGTAAAAPAASVASKDTTKPRVTIVDPEDGKEYTRVPQMEIVEQEKLNRVVSMRAHNVVEVNRVLSYV